MSRKYIPKLPNNEMLIPLGEGNYNVAFYFKDQQKNEWVYKEQKPFVSETTSGLDKPKRSANVFNDVTGLYANEYGQGWVSPFIKGVDPSDEEIAREVLDIYKRTGRVVIDACGVGNFKKTDEKKIVCVDIGMALKRGSIDSDNVWKYPNMRLQTASYWREFEYKYKRPGTVKVTKILKYIDDEISPEKIKKDDLTYDVLIDHNKMEADWLKPVKILLNYQEMLLKQRNMDLDLYTIEAVLLLQGELANRNIKMSFEAVYKTMPIKEIMEWKVILKDDHQVFPSLDAIQTMIKLRNNLMQHGITLKPKSVYEVCLNKKLLERVFSALKYLDASPKNRFQFDFNRGCFTKSGSDDTLHYLTVIICHPEVLESETRQFLNGGQSHYAIQQQERVYKPSDPNSKGSRASYFESDNFQKGIENSNPNF